jgi:site-specific recombinase XerD
MNTHPLELLISQYLAEKDITRGTFDLYNIILKQYTLYLKEHQILYAKTSDVKNYREWKRNQGYSVRWIYHQISAIKGLYRYLSFNQKRLELPLEYAYDITESIKNEHIKSGISKPILTIDQAKHLILCTKRIRKYIWHYRDHAMVYLMITTGLRSIEIRRARKKDLRVVNNQLILYVQGKGRQSADEFVKISKGVEEAIGDYLDESEIQAYDMDSIVVNTQEHYRTMMEKLLLEKELYKDFSNEQPMDESQEKRARDFYDIHKNWIYYNKKLPFDYIELKHMIESRIKNRRDRTSIHLNEYNQYKLTEMFSKKSIARQLNEIDKRKLSIRDLDIDDILVSLRELDNAVKDLMSHN